MTALREQSFESVNGTEEQPCFEFDSSASELSSESKLHFDTIDVTSPTPVSITRDVVVSAMEYKLTK